METPSVAELNTQHFYDWEIRGRGWYLSDVPVEIEPYYTPYTFPWHAVRANDQVDDGKKRSLWNQFKDSFQPIQRVQESEEVNDFQRHLAYEFVPPNENQLRAFEVLLPREYDLDAGASERLLQVLSLSSLPISFEIHATHEHIKLCWTCYSTDVELLISQFRTYFPSVGLREFYYEDFGLTSDFVPAIVDFGLSNEFMLPIAQHSSLKPDPLAGLIGLSDRLEQGESLIYQVIFQGCKNPWASSVKASVSDGQGGSFFEDMVEMPRYASEKTSSQLYSSVIRLLVQAETDNRKRILGNTAINALVSQSRSSVNSIIPLVNENFDLEKHFFAVYDRVSYRPGMILNCTELLSFVHLLDSSVRSFNIDRASSKTKPVQRAYKAGKYFLGINTHLESETPVFLSDEDRLRHTHIVGATGTGKSNLLINLIVQDIKAGVGCAVLDPHGDLIENVLSSISIEQADNIILIDPTDVDFPIGINILSANTEMEKMLLSSDLVGLFQQQATSWGDQMTAILSNAINAILESKKEGSVLDLRFFLTDAVKRNEFLRSVEDPLTLHYWSSEFTQQKRSAPVSSIITRLDTFLRSKIIRNMVVQEQGLNFRDILDAGKTLLVKLPIGLIGEQNSYLLGSIITTKLYQAALGRQNVSQEHRKPYYIYLDEFQHFQTPAMKGILSGARKYGLGLILAHQDISQLKAVDGELASAVLSNPAIRLIFRTGENDARRLTHELSYFTEDDIQSLSTGQCIARLGLKNNDCNIIIPKAQVSSKENRQVWNVVLENSRKYSSPPQDFTVNKASEGHIEKDDEAPIEVPQPASKAEERPDKVVSTVGEVKEEDVQKYIQKETDKMQITLHRSLQMKMREIAHKLGFKASIEEQLEGGLRVDVGLQMDGIRVGCEIAVTNTVEYEMNNVQKCFDAGFSHVIILVEDVKHRRNIEKKVESTFTKLRPRIFITPIEKVEYILSEILPKGPQKTVKRIKGYKVNVTYEKSGDGKNRDEIISQVIIDSTKRKKK